MSTYDEKVKNLVSTITKFEKVRSDKIRSINNTYGMVQVRLRQDLADYELKQMVKIFAMASVLEKEMIEK